MEENFLRRSPYKALKFNERPVVERKQLLIRKSKNDDLNNPFSGVAQIKFDGYLVCKTATSSRLALDHNARLIRERYMKQMKELYGMDRLDKMNTLDLFFAGKHSLKNRISLYKTDRDKYIFYEDAEFTDRESGKVFIDKLIHCETEDKNELARVGIDFLKSDEYDDLLRYLNDDIKLID